MYTLIALSYYGPSHTDGDISAYFVEADYFIPAGHLVETVITRSSIIPPAAISRA